MPAAWGFKWTRPPSAVATELAVFGAKILAATTITGNLIAGMAESDAKANAPWQDQTGGARAGLTGASEVAGFLVTIYLFHTVEYGKWLEIAMGMRYQIINPTLMRLYPIIWVILRRELGT